MDAGEKRGPMENYDIPGNYDEGLPHRQGIFGFEDGRTFNGTFHYGLKHWSGIYTDLTGIPRKTLWFHDKQMSSESCDDLESTLNIIRGPMRLPLSEGFVDVIYANDSTYIGKIQSDVPHGNGESASTNRKWIIKGEFDDDSFKSGVIEHENGIVSEGGFREAFDSLYLHGRGKQIHPDGVHLRRRFSAWSS